VKRPFVIGIHLAALTLVGSDQLSAQVQISDNQRLVLMPKGQTVNEVALGAA
jgi:hypothetical protein